jgi:hypothetical protein
VRTTLPILSEDSLLSHLLPFTGCTYLPCALQKSIVLLNLRYLARYAKMNPHHQIPTLRVEQDYGAASVIWESNTIVRFLASKYGPRLHGGTPEALAAGSMWMDWSLHGSNFASSFGKHRVPVQLLTTTCFPAQTMY